MTCLLILNICKRHCCILRFKSVMILSLQKFSTYCPLLINGMIHPDPIFYTSSIVRRSHFSAPYHNRYIIWEKPMSAECAEVSNKPHSAIHLRVSEFPTLDSNSAYKLKMTGDTKLVDWCSHMIRMYSKTVYLLHFSKGCHTTVNHFTTLHLLSIRDMIARWNILILTKGSCLNLMISGSIIWKVTLISPSNAEFLLVQHHTVAGLHLISSSNFRSTFLPEKRYWHCLRGARRLNTGYFILKLKIMQWWFQQSTKIGMVGPIVLTGSSGLSKRLIWCILFLSEQLLDWHTGCESMLHQIESIAYGL